MQRYEIIHVYLHLHAHTHTPIPLHAHAHARMLNCYRCKHSYWSQEFQHSAEATTDWFKQIHKHHMFFDRSVELSRQWESRTNWGDFFLQNKNNIQRFYARLSMLFMIAGLTTNHG